MLKRHSSEQITRENAGGSDDNGSWPVASGPPKATAAQLANRSRYAIKTLVKVSEENYFALMEAKRACIDRIAQPRGGRRPAAPGTRRPASPSPAINNQQETPAFGQTNGAQQTQSGGGFTFGQSSASASFPPFPNSNNNGNSSSFNPPSSSFSFGSQLSSNPFAPTATFGGNGNKETDQSTAEVQYSPSNNLFLQSSEVIKADAASAGLSPSVAAPQLGGFTFTKSSPLPEPGQVDPIKPPKKPLLHLNPPKDPMARKRPAEDELDDEGYPAKPAGPGRPAVSHSADRVAMPAPPVPVKGQPMVFHNSAPPSKPGTYGSAGRTRTLPTQPDPGQSKPFVFNNTAPPSKPGTFGSAGRTIPLPATRAPLLIPKDPNADEMDTEATSAATVAPAPAQQNIFGGFGSAPVSTNNVFGNSNRSPVPQGLIPDFLAPVTQGSLPSHDTDEMHMDIPEPFQPLEDYSAWNTIFDETIAGWQNADVMDTEDLAVSEPAHNPFQSQLPSQGNPSVFANLGKTPATTFSFGQQNSSTSSQQAPLPAFNWGQQVASASTQPQQSSTPAFNWGQQSTPASPQLQQNPAPTFNWGQQATSASTQPQQSSTPAFNWGQQSTPASSHPQVTSTPAFNWGQQITSTSTQSQPSLTPAFAFTQPGTATQDHEPSDSDAMVVSPEKKPLGGSLFDRIERPPASDPASFGQNTNGGTSQSGETQRPPSPRKEARKLAEPRKHVEDKPIQDNPFGSLFVPKEQSSVTASSPFAPKSQHNIAPTSDLPSSSGLFGSLTNKNGQDATNLFKSLDQKTASTSNLFKLSSVNEATTDQNVSNMFGAQTQAANRSGTLDQFKPSVAETTSRDGRDPSQPSSTTQNTGGQAAGVASKQTNSVNYTADAAKEQPKVAGRKRGQPPEPPQYWTVEEKKQYHIAYRLKQLDVGVEAKRQALISARQSQRIKQLEEFYRKTRRNIKAGRRDSVKSASASHAHNSEQTEIQSAWPPITRGSNKRANGPERTEDATSSKRLRAEQENQNFESAGPVASTTQKADDRVDRQKDQAPNESGKRARIAEGDQVSYPSITTAEPSSKTSSMFKNILDKSVAVTNGESTTQSPLPSFKLSESGPSVLTQPPNNETPASQTAPNMFAASAAKFQANAADARNGITRESPQKKFPTTEPAKPPSSPFVFKPVTANNGTSSTANNAAVKPPAFGNSGGPTNFLAQFGQKSAADSKKEMEKRKAEEMDSDEDEAEWERRDAEEQRKKKLKMEQEASKLKPKFVPGKGFVFETSGDENAKPSGTLAAGTASQAQESVLHGNELDRQHDEYAKQQAAASTFVNPFAKLAKQDSGNESSKNGDADDEEEGTDEENQASKKPSGGSLFGRITAPSTKANDDASQEHPLKASSQGINLFGHISGAAASVPAFNARTQTASPPKTNPFGKLSSSTASQNVFGTPTSARPPNAPGSGEKGDNTWNPESPIKFGGSPDAGNKKHPREDDGTEEGQGDAKRTDVKVAPALNITSPSPSKTPLGSLFGAAKTNTAIETPSKALFNITAPTPTSSVPSSFGFGISPVKTASLFPPSNNTPNGVSRSTSPGATTGESATESNAEGDDEGMEKHEQLNLTSGGPGEEDEDVLYEVRAKANLWDSKKENEKGEKKGGWEVKGLGPFRIMKHRKTGKARMLMRSDPAGRIIINSSISKQLKYDALTKNSFRVPLMSSAQKMETWLVKVGKDCDAADIVRMLEENKDQN